jgi:hypothetical protein
MRLYTNEHKLFAPAESQAERGTLAGLEHIRKREFGAGRNLRMFNADFFQAIKLIYGYAQGPSCQERS